MARTYPVAGEPVVVVGLTELNRSLKLTGLQATKAMRTGLRVAVEPIAKDSQRLAEADVSGMKRAKLKPPPWSIPRIGVTATEVYMVPRERGTKGRGDDPRRRPNFVVLMLGKSYDPALEGNRAQVGNTVDRFIGSVTREF